MEKVLVHFIAKKNEEGSRWKSCSATLNVDKVEWPEKDVGEPRPPPKLYVDGHLISGISFLEIKPGGQVVAILKKVGHTVRFHPLGTIESMEVLPSK